MNTETEHSSPIEFPCEFLVKAVCKSSDNIEQYILELAQKHFPNLTSENITLRKSKQEKYSALSINVYAENQEQLDAIYQDLTDSQHILMAF